jgi:hypothetical protein
VSSLVTHARRFDADVTRVRRAFVHLRKIIAATKRELHTRERGLHRQNVLWQEDLKQHQRLMRRQRPIWLCKLLPLSLMLVVLATCRALLSGAVWFLHYSSRLILIRSSWLAESARVLEVGVARVRWAKLEALVPALPIAAITLVTVGMVFTAKPVTPVEVVLPIVPDTQGPATLTTAALGEVLREPTETSSLSPSVAPGFARVSLVSKTVPEPLPVSGKDITSMMLPMPPLPAPETTSRISDPAPTEVTEPRPLPHTGTPSTISPTTALASAPAKVGKAAPAMLRPVAKRPEPTSEPPQRRQTNPTEGGQRRDFVPHAFW